MAANISNQLGGFVSFALATGLHVNRLRSPAAGDHGMAFSAEETLSPPEVSSLEALMARYEPLRSILQAPTSATEAAGLSHVKATLAANVDYKLIRVNAEQFKLAKQVAEKVDRIYALHVSGKKIDAAKAYDEYQSFIADKRQTLLGDFKNIKMTPVEAFGANPHVGGEQECAPLIIFVIAEIITDCRTM